MRSDLYLVDLEEFQEIELRLVRNDDWLRVFRKRGFYLSENFPLITLKLPYGFTRMEEKDIDKLKEHIKSELSKTELEEEEQ